MLFRSRKSSARPDNIPSNPDNAYRDAGWVSYPDWMGYGSVSFLPFERARAAVRKLGLTSAREWYQWNKSGARPNNIPSHPDKVYRDAGWVSLPNWMGYKPRRTHKPPTTSWLESCLLASCTGQLETFGNTFGIDRPRGKNCVPSIRF